MITTKLIRSYHSIIAGVIVDIIIITCSDGEYRVTQVCVPEVNWKQLLGVSRKLKLELKLNQSDRTLLESNG